MCRLYKNSDRTNCSTRENCSSCLLIHSFNLVIQNTQGRLYRCHKYPYFSRLYPAWSLTDVLWQFLALSINIETSSSSFLFWAFGGVCVHHCPWKNGHLPVHLSLSPLSHYKGISSGNYVDTWEKKKQRKNILWYMLLLQSTSTLCYNELARLETETIIKKKWERRKKRKTNTSQNQWSKPKKKDCFDEK